MSEVVMFKRGDKVRFISGDFAGRTGVFHGYLNNGYFIVPRVEVWNDKGESGLFYTYGDCIVPLLDAKDNVNDE